jgi:hypothetical protein
MYRGSLWFIAISIASLARAVPTERSTFDDIKDALSHINLPKAVHDAEDAFSHIQIPDEVKDALSHIDLPKAVHDVEEALSHVEIPEEIKDNAQKLGEYLKNLTSAMVPGHIAATLVSSEPIAEGEPDGNLTATPPAQPASAPGRELECLLKVLEKVAEKMESETGGTLQERGKKKRHEDDERRRREEYDEMMRQ